MTPSEISTGIAAPAGALKVAVSALVAICLTGCASSQRTAFTTADATEAVVPGFTGIRTWGDAAPEAFERDGPRPSRKSGGHLRILALSGGGSGGAFAAGVLSGWSATGQRPQFDLVSGVSTGALIAPYAFLGPAYDRELTYIYTSGIASTLAKRKWLPSGLLGSGLMDAAPLRRLVETYANAAMMRAVAKEHRKGRRLMVVTTNMDAQRPVVWNMGAIAASGRPDALKLFQDVLVASASIPAVFPPVMIHVDAGGKRFDEMHSDGATSNQVFALPDSLLTSNSAPRLPKGLKSDLYIIVNNALMPEFSLTSDSTFAVGGRALATMMKSQTRGSINATFGFARANGIGFHVAAIDQAVPYDATDPFNTEYMRTLFQLGYRQATTGTAWKDTPVFQAAQPAQASLASNAGFAVRPAGRGLASQGGTAAPDVRPATLQ